MRALHSPVAGRFSAVAALLLVVACGGPANNDSLFTPGGGSALSAGGAGATGTGGGSSVGGNTTGGSAVGGNTTGGGSGGGNTGSGGGSAGAASSSGTGGQLTSGGTAGAPNGGVAGSFGGAPNGGAGGGAGGTATGGTGAGTLADCSQFGSNVAYDSETKHCYLVVNASATFAAARNHCANLGAHLVTLSSQQENDFVWSLDNSAHWIGATDGKSPKETGPGTYSWLDGEPFTYTDWSAGQPNASQTTCSDAMGGGPCYEHCAFQWADGATAGEWNDRLCTHTIDSVCEWDG